MQSNWCLKNRVRYTPSSLRTATPPDSMLGSHQTAWETGLKELASYGIAWWLLFGLHPISVIEGGNAVNAPRQLDCSSGCSK